MKIETKAQMYAMARRGLFGNTWWEWTPAEFLADTKPLQMFRSSEKVWGVRSGGKPGGPFHRDLTYMKAWEIGKEVERAHGGAMISPMTYAFPDMRCELQGYMTETTFGLYFNEADPSVDMRRGFKLSSKHWWGVQVRMVLRHHLREDYDWVVGLLDDYPESVVEFSVMSKPTGRLNKRTLIWEVRHY